MMGRYFKENDNGNAKKTVFHIDDKVVDKVKNTNPKKYKKQGMTAALHGHFDIRISAN